MVAEPMTTMKRIMNTENAKAERRAKRRKKYRWSDAQRKRFSATMAAKRQGKGPDRMEEVAALLEQGKTWSEIGKQLKMSQNAVRYRADLLHKKKPSKTTMMIPADAIPPRRSAPIPARRVTLSSAPQRAMRVVVKAGSEITVTIGGVEVQIVAEG